MAKGSALNTHLFEEMGSKEEAHTMNLSFGHDWIKTFLVIFYCRRVNYSHISY